MSDSPVFRSVRRPDRRRRSAMGRVARWTVVLLVIALLAGIGVLVRKATTAMRPLELQTLVLNDIDPDAPVDPVEGTSTTLLVGVDRRDVQPESISTSTADPRGAALTPMVALVQTTPARDGTAVVVFPPDLQVRPPGLLDIGTTRLDQVQALGGPDALLATVQELAQVPIDHYVELDLAGVVDVVDAVGGVQVCLDDVVPGPEPGSPAARVDDATPSGAPGTAAPTDEPATTSAASAPATPSTTPSASGTDAAATATPSPAAGTATPSAAAGTDGTADPVDVDDGVSAGCQVLDGAAAAGFLSSRSDADEPLAVQRLRLAQQHHLLARVLDQMTVGALLVDPMRLNTILDTLQDAVASDVDPGLRGMFEVAGDIASFDPGNLVVRVVPSYRRSADGDTLLYVDEATTLFQALRAGESLQGMGEITSDEVGPEDVTVLVVNGVGTPGLAGSAASYLGSRGFTVACAVNPSDLDPRATFDPDLESIVVQYRAADRVLAELVLEALGSLPVQDMEVEVMPPLPDAPECAFDEDGATVVLTVGSAWE